MARPLLSNVKDTAARSHTVEALSFIYTFDGTAAIYPVATSVIRFDTWRCRSTKMQTDKYRCF